MSLRDIENFRLIDGEKIDNLPADTASELAGKVEEAPTDGKKYARQNSAWSEVTTGGG
ncbi:MAG: phage neck protein fibritin [Candidatus Marinimicrobia bacterium]|nr:phage neck protein fibritin [Candidatus Neomarinimicrobiota bacterium]